MSWPAVTFTHSGGEHRIRWWAEGIRQAGLIPVVCDDARDPLPGTARGWLHAAGVEYRQTRWDRRGNLNGTDVAAGICRELAAAAERHAAPYALKVDDDTAICDPEIFTCAEQAGAVGLTWTAGGRSEAFGMAYALRADVAAGAAEALALLPLDATAPEDLTVWRAAVALSGPAGVMRWDFDPEAGPFSALPANADVCDAVRRFAVLTVGNPPAGGWKDRSRETSARLLHVLRAVRAERLHG